MKNPKFYISTLPSTRNFIRCLETGVKIVLIIRVDDCGETNPRKQTTEFSVSFHVCRFEEVATGQHAFGLIDPHEMLGFTQFVGRIDYETRIGFVEGISQGEFG